MRQIKRLLFIFFCALIFFISAQSAFAGVKINNVTFDSSSGFMFLSTTKTVDTEAASEGNISSVVLKSPNRVFFDIPDAVLTRPNETWYFKGSDITQIKVSQFTTNPNVVRVVFYYNDNFNPKKISVINVKGNILFKYGEIKLSQSDNYRAYRSEHSSQSDFIEKMVYIPASEVALQEQAQQAASANVQNIQKAFGQTNGVVLSPASPSPVAATAGTKQDFPTNFNWSKVFKLRTNYFLSRVDVKRGNVLLLGMGRAAVEKPIYLSNPTRVVFDMPNTMVAQKFKNVEIQISDTETLKVGQFEPSKVRLVITTSNPQAYRPIFSGDGQGLLIANDTRMSGIKLYDKGAQTLKTVVKAQNSLTDVFTVDYAAPVVYSLKENKETLELLVYNATGYNDEFFKTAIKGTNLASTQGSKMNIGGVKYVFKLAPDAEIDSYVREDGKQLRLVIKNKKTTPQPKPTPEKPSAGSYKGCGLIVIDPGHGGLDGGAIRAGINEKDINLDVSKLIAQILKKRGYKVDLTRWDDSTLSLQDRVDFSDSKKASIFVSVHVNSSVSEEPKGIETHWWTDEGYELAKVVHSSFAKKVSTNDRGLMKSKFYVINHTLAKSILVEIGFISNDNERNELLTKERKQKTAEGIAEGIIKFMEKEGIK